MHVVITGASSGIGEALAREYFTRRAAVTLVARRRELLDKLAKDTDAKTHLVQADLSEPGQVTSWVDEAERALGPIDVLINNAGVSSQSATLALTTSEELARCFAINATSPVMVAKALLPNLRAGSRRLIVNVSTQLASITNNSGGSSYAYRASKTALNQLTVCMANELRADGFTVVAMHPGWVKTDMGGPKAPLSAEQAVAHILATIDRLTPADSGRFLNYDGGPMPW